MTAGISSAKNSVVLFFVIRRLKIGDLGGPGRGRIKGEDDVRFLGNVSSVGNNNDRYIYQLVQLPPPTSGDPLMAPTKITNIGANINANNNINETIYSGAGNTPNRRWL